MITKRTIKKLKPCNDRLQNYLKFYDGKSFTHRQFMGLKNISHSDKVWVSFRLMSKENVVLAAADIAESVLHIFEKEYPNDKRPRRAIEAARRGDSNAAHAANAANAANCAAALAAAYAANAANCAANAANCAAAYYAANAAHAAALAALATLAANAAYAANAANVANKQKQEKLIRTIVLKYWKEKEK